MDFGSMLDDSFAYAKDGVWGRWSRWLLLIVSLIIFPLMNGYLVRIFRGEKPAPEPREWLSLFIDGVKLLLIQIIYLLPVMLLVILAFIPLISTLISAGMFSQDFGSMSDSQFEQWMNNNPEILVELLITGGFMVLLLLFAILVAIIVGIFMFLGVVRFARLRSIGEAFNFSAIWSHIGRIGWFNYILALLIIGIIGFIFGMVLNFFAIIPFIGIFIELALMAILYVPYSLFSARYSALVYDAGEEKPSQVLEPAVQSPVS